MTYSDFCTVFNGLNDCVGTDTTDDTQTHYYVNAEGKVGEARYNRRTTVTVCSILTGETAEMVRYWYGPNGPRGPKRTGTVVVTIEHAPSLTPADALLSLLSGDRDHGDARILSLS